MTYVIYFDDKLVPVIFDTKKEAEENAINRARMSSRPARVFALLPCLDIDFQMIKHEYRYDDKPPEEIENA